MVVKVCGICKLGSWDRLVHSYSVTDYIVNHCDFMPVKVVDVVCQSSLRYDLL